MKISEITRETIDACVNSYIEGSISLNELKSIFDRFELDFDKNKLDMFTHLNVVYLNNIFRSKLLDKGYYPYKCSDENSFSSLCKLLDMDCSRVEVFLSNVIKEIKNRIPKEERDLTTIFYKVQILSKKNISISAFAIKKSIDNKLELIYGADDVYYLSRASKQERLDMKDSHERDRKYILKSINLHNYTQDLNNK